jgi:myo-inositol-1(or 4)-monophosphatase
MDNQKYLKVALKAAKQAGPLFKKHFGNAGKVNIKNNDPRNLVTKIDLAIEKQIRQAILKNFPGSKIIGEEFGSSKLEIGDVVWMIDPIDGTSNYISGIPLTCIAIGVWDKKGPLAGAVYNPVINQIYTALRGKGAYLNNKKINPSKVTSISLATGALGWRLPQEGKKTFNKLIDLVGKARVMATSSWQTCMVASGALDYYVTTDVNIWDLGGPLAVLQEAGGKFSDFKGNLSKIDLKEIVASNGKIHDELLKKLNTKHAS